MSLLEGSHPFRTTQQTSTGFNCEMMSPEGVIYTGCFQESTKSIEENDRKNCDRAIDMNENCGGDSGDSFPKMSIFYDFPLQNSAYRGKLDQAFAWFDRQKTKIKKALQNKVSGFFKRKGVSSSSSSSTSSTTESSSTEPPSKKTKTDE